MLIGRPVEFISGGEHEHQVPKSRSGGVASGRDFRPVGTTIRFLPLIRPDGRIYLEVEPQFTYPPPDSEEVIFGSTSQRVSTRAVMNPGQIFCIVCHKAEGGTSEPARPAALTFFDILFGCDHALDCEEDLIICVTPVLDEPWDADQ